MNIIRFILGRIILFLDWMTSPKPIPVSPEKIKFIQEKVKDMEIYEFKACPFCVRVRRFMKKNNISIKIKDARRNKDFADEPVHSTILGLLLWPLFSNEQKNIQHSTLTFFESVKRMFKNFF